MKKILNTKTFLFIVTAIIFTCFGVYAANLYKASDVVYNASDGTSMNVSDALNDLYNKSKNTGTYKSYSFSLEPATLGGTIGTTGEYKSDTWTTMTYQKTSNCKNKVCTFEGGYVSFEIDLGFTPSYVESAQVYLSTYDEKETSSTGFLTYGFRLQKGYASNSTSVQYYYMRRLMAVYPKNNFPRYKTVEEVEVPLPDGTYTTQREVSTIYSAEPDVILGNNSTTSAWQYTSVEIEGSKLIFKVNIERKNLVNGTSNTDLQVKTNSLQFKPSELGTGLYPPFYLSGTIIYK